MRKFFNLEPQSKETVGVFLLLKINLFFYHDGTMTPLFFILGVFKGS